MLTCLEIINILYIKCVTFCESIKNSYNSTFNDLRHRPEVYNNNKYNYSYTNELFTTKYNKDVIIDMDKQILVETVSGPVFLNTNNKVIEPNKLATIDEKTTLETFTTESKIEGDNDGDWSIIMDDSN